MDEEPLLPSASIESVTALIERAQSGQGEAWDQVYGLLYDELHQIAQQRLRQWSEGRSATSLVNRAWLRFDPSRLSLQNRQHLLAVMARSMRYALLDEAERLKALKRQAGAPAPEDAVDTLGYDPRLDEMLALSVALNELSAAYPRLGTVVEMRYFAGMTEIEIAEALGLTERTVRRDWLKARAFLVSQLGAPLASGGD
ncbi:sigma-70 family RNA polymerase sigma factor [Lysobacter sp. 5GHs7-4]|uniref:ECF-type sigma factor n=1 Tax=Lysobacter sp. 5GHs7-4 TaxID=2904253 RepID=UPI001E65392D|nr:ECF-type sigma factor [Lysobacter sp. 5GHs7-4]UHQ23218.1 sigma-70 family RNA polymerase sigma factor [Lysobacter sp. 5GHs7-4]